MTYSSKLLESAVNELAKLPGVGRKTALRLALHLLKQDQGAVEMLSRSIVRMKEDIKHCSGCHNISDSDICEICSSGKRDRKILCVVQDIRDIMAIENTGQYSGLYHVLGGILSPMEGIGPNDLNIVSLEKRIREDEIKEIILALPTTVEGDTTNYYLFRKLKDASVLITTLARGVSIGDDIEYADEITLGRSIIHRLPYTE